MNSLHYLLHSGKSPKFVYYGLNYLRMAIPDGLYRMRLARLLDSVDSRPDADYIHRRVDYCCKLSVDTSEEQRQAWAEQLQPLADMQMTDQKVYYFDTREYTRWFRKDLRLALLPGDIVEVPDVPTIVKSRPLGDNANSVMLKLNKVRHFIYTNDSKPFTEKADKVIFRGKIGKPGSPMYKEKRYRFMQQYFGNPLCDLGEVQGRYANQEWVKEKMTISQHLDSKFIMALEGNDVASNLKWVMSSNALAVMPLPTCETWFMEGTLIPNYHYVEIKSDFSDLEERIQYYIDHPDEAQDIIDHAHEYVRQFQDKEREDLISLLVLQKYFECTNPLELLPSVR